MLWLERFRTTVLEIKNAVVVVLIFLKQNGLCGALANSNYFYTEESHARTFVHAVSEGHKNK